MQNPKVFISYSREFDSHSDRVLAFANRLRSEGIDVILDRYKEFGPREGWSLWMTQVLREGGFVLIICCPSYYARVMGDAAPGTGQGVRWEGNLILQYLKESDTYNDRFLPVLFDDGNIKNIPDPLRSFQFFKLKDEEGYNQLYRRLTCQPAISIPPLGPLKVLAPKEIKTDFFSPATSHIPRNIPSSINHYFKGREPFLDQIHKTLSASGPAGQHRAAAITASAPVAAVHGLGGIGKTRVAVEYAHRYADQYNAILFVPADSAANLEASLAKLCQSDVLNLPEKHAKEQEIQTAAAVSWLQQKSGWLLIFDNVDTEDAAKAVKSKLPQIAHSGRILITARFGDWPNTVESLPLDVLAAQDAADFLLERTAPRRRQASDDLAQARDLAKTLGYLALALEQAGACIYANRLTFAQYCDQWQTQHGKVIAWYNENHMQSPKSVAVTWQTSFDQLTDPARQLLQRLAWFAPEPIPESLLYVQAGSPDAPDWFEALANLETYSLVTRSNDTSTFTIHRLVQDVTRCNLESDTDHTALKNALNWINNAFVGDPQDVRSWPILDPLAPHALACAQFAVQEKVSEPTARLLSQLGLLFFIKAQNTHAEPLMLRALSIGEQSFGKDHPNVATALSNLAALFHATNRHAEAEHLKRRALAIDEQSFGKDHPNVAIRLNNLATLLKSTNRLAEAEPLFRRALAIDEQSLGKDHPNVAIQLNNLATLLQDTNRLAEAEPLMRRALAIDEQSFGKDHPNVAIRLNNLARLLQDTNRLAEAEPLMRRMVEIFLQFTQANRHAHPHLNAAIANYDGLLKAMGKTTEEIKNTLDALLKPFGVKLQSP